MNANDHPENALVLHHPSEIAVAAVASQARAAIEARYSMALHRPRSIERVRISLLAECKRPGFAAAAIYRKPIGVDRQGNKKYAEGPSIRFAEAAIRLMGNIYTEVMLVFEDAERRVLNVVASDCETNATYSRSISIAKTVERSKLRKGQIPIGERVNSEGQPTYLVEATEDDLLVKEASAVSKALRVLALRLVPGDILEEAVAQARLTMKTENAKDPKAGLRQITDAFAELGVMPDDLHRYLGHTIEAASPAEVQSLREIYRAVKDGDMSWSDLQEEAQSREAERSERSAERKAKVDRLRTKADAKADGAIAHEADGTTIDARTGEVLDPPKPAATAGDFWRAVKSAGVSKAEASEIVRRLFPSADVEAGPAGLVPEQIAQAVTEIARLGKELDHKGESK